MAQRSAFWNTFVNSIASELVVHQKIVKRLAHGFFPVFGFGASSSILSSSLSGQLPPDATAKSTMIEPAFMSFTNVAGIRTGAGFPGIVLAIFNKNPSFHVKLYEKSKVKCSFLEYLVKKIKVDVEICKGNLEEKKIDADYVVCRAFKKFPEIIRISREIIKKPHKLIVLKGKNAQEEINNTLNLGRYSYRLENSITDKESKIIILDINKKK